ncbi:MAG TPA: hypothetical protein VHX38_11195 [Pseudonocardiaceae bacterium]|jgi:hypothetical protein|nr:hypothetical protein [Pseudonocardiaceae bacterium]
MGRATGRGTRQTADQQSAGVPVVGQQTDGQSVAGPQVVGRSEADPSRRRALRGAAREVVRHWESLRERVPAPVLRVLVTLPWLLRRMPVPFWVPLLLMLLRRIARRRARRAAKRGARNAEVTGSADR